MERQPFKCRFIPDRRPDLWAYFSVAPPPEKMSLMQNICSFPNRNYEKVLRQMLKVPRLEQNFLFPILKQTQENTSKQWPARPRRKPYIRAPHLILDLPSFDNDIAMNTIDWGPAGIVCALGRLLYLWKESKEIRSFACVSQTGEIITSVKCHPTGSKIAVGTNKSLIKVWNTDPVKLYKYTYCCSQSLICALEWHPSGLSLISGCSNGCLMEFSLESTYTRRLFSYVQDSVSSIQFSESGDLMATASIDGQLILWDWKNRKPVADLHSLSSCKSFAWHPWNSILAIGTTEDGGTIHIIFMKKGNKLTYKSITPMQVLNLTWSKVTGELVASVMVTQESGQMINTILIFGSLGEIVDIINMDDIHARCCYLLWSPDGYEIGTVTPSEVLMIWKFCEKRQKNSSLRTSSRSTSNGHSCLSFSGIHSIIR